MTERVLVTGGAGFIGSHVVDGLIRGGYSVAVLDNLSTGSWDYVNKEARRYTGNVRRDSRAVICTEHPDYVIHNAAQINVRNSILNPIKDAEQNIIGSLALFKACTIFGTELKKIIFAVQPINEIRIITIKNTRAFAI